MVQDQLQDVEQAQLLVEQLIRTKSVAKFGTLSIQIMHADRRVCAAEKLLDAMQTSRTVFQDD